MLPQDLCRLDQRHLWRDGPVGPNFHRELVVVGLLANTGLFDLILHPGDRAEHSIHGNNADFLRCLALLTGRHVTAAILDHHLELKRHVVSQIRQHEILIDNLDRFVRLDVGSGHRAAGALFYPHHAGGITVVLDHETLHREHDVGGILENTLDRRELME